MKMLVRAASLGIAAAALPALVPAPAAAQTVNGIAVADLDQAAVNSNAYRAAATQRQTQYKPQIDAARAAQAAAAARLKPLADRFNADRAKPNANQQALQTQLNEIQRIQNESEQQMQTIVQPIALSQAYVNEQIQDQIEGALKAAMARRNVTLVLDERATLSHAQSYDLTADVTAELNRLIPSAQLVPPAGWMPRAQREAMARQQGQAAPAAPAPRQNTPQPKSR